MGKKAKQKLQDDIDRGVYGEPLKYDANFLGPRAERSCTDIFFLLMLVCFVITWIVIGIIAFKQGDPSKFIAPVDSHGRRCGYDTEVEDKKYLFYFDITKCSFEGCDTPQVCVEKCPKEIYIGALYIENGDKENAREKSICRGDKPAPEDMEKAIEHNQCAAWYIPFKSFVRRCIIISLDDIFDDILVLQLTDIFGINIDDLRKASAEAKSQVEKIAQSIVSDLGKKWPLLLGGLVIAMVLSMIYIAILCYFSWIFVWVSLIGVLGFWALCVYVSWIIYTRAQDIEKANIHSDGSLKVTWLIVFITSCVILAVWFLLIVFLRGRIRIAVNLISEASRAVVNIMSTLFFPLVPWILEMGIIVWTVTVWIYLASSGIPIFQVQGLNNGNCSCSSFSNKDLCEPDVFNKQCISAIANCGNVSCSFRTYESRSYTLYFHAFNIVGFIWILCFISAFSDMALAGTFSTWYWTFKKSKVPFLALTQSLGRMFRYHIGTLAFGSLIMTICRLIRVFLGAQLGSNNNIGLAKAVLCCFKCFFGWLEKLIKFINRNTYIMCAIHGKNFCHSAQKGFHLVMRNIIRVFVVDKVTNFLLLQGKLLITGGMVALAFYVISNNVTDDDDVPQYAYYILPLLIVGISTFIVASTFFSVYAMAVDTIFLCFLEDLERNDGSPEKPYYMSKNLLKILGKKNKKYEEK